MDFIGEIPLKGGNATKNVWKTKDKGKKNVIKNVDIRETPPKRGNVRKNVWQTKAEKLKAKDFYKMSAN